MFQKLLNKPLDSVDGARACLLLGFDGIPIASTFASEEPREALTAMAVEVSGLLGKMARSKTAREMGTMASLSLRTDRYVVVGHVVLEDYILLLTVEVATDIDRATRALRLIAPAIEGLM